MQDKKRKYLINAAKTEAGSPAVLKGQYWFQMQHGDPLLSGFFFCLLNRNWSQVEQVKEDLSLRGKWEVTPILTGIKAVEVMEGNRWPTS